MSWPRHQEPNRDRRAKAPYNFVPLPEKVKWAAEIPDLSIYHSDRFTGRLECELMTSSPLYIRAGLTEEQIGEGANAKDQPDFFYTDPHTKDPVIPGSCLRGMLRALIEIISYSKVQPVTPMQKITYRAVAAPTSDPLSQPYKSALGPYGRDVKAGYLLRRGKHWYIQPAQRPRDAGLQEKKAYLKVKDRQIPDGAIPDLIRFRSAHYRPQYHDVSFVGEIRRGKRGEYVAVTQIGSRDAEYKHRGVLVCSGNMAESGGGGSRRKNHALVLERDTKAKEIPISEQAVEDYLDSLTEFQKQSPPFDEKLGCLIEGRPVFYVEDRGEVCAFGHTPNFRIPAWLDGTEPKRAATPLDFVPIALRDPNQTDLAEAMFGYVEPAEQDVRPVAYAGRISIVDATLAPGQDNPWLFNDPITPKILATPKPTTFQHYLVQTEPNNKQNLHHYGSPTPDGTVIRGHKLYWHKGNVEVNDFEETEPVTSGDTQHTHIMPLRSEVRFDFRIYFENLTEVELGALLWLMDIARDDDYRLKLGMGKPLGLGAVKIESDLYLTNRRARYTSLLDGSDWETGDMAQDEIGQARQQAISAFEQWILTDSVLNPNGATKLMDVERIQMLTTLLSWPGPDKRETRYLEIEHPQNANEYKDRPVLPTPRGVKDGTATRSPDTLSLSPSSSPKPRTPRKPQEVKHPRTVDDIEQDDLLEGSIIAVEPNRVVVDLGVARGSMGLTMLDEWTRRDPWFKEMYPGRVPAATELFAQGELDDILLDTRMQVRVRRIERDSKGERKIKLTPVKWMEED